ncbi:hypothetical protein [Methylocella silvestris]|nr:hypothetical protein [Methylocella silvestris]
MSRRYVGPVPGGHPIRDFPNWPSLHQFDSLTTHAQGRMQSLAGQAFMLLKLKSRGKIGDADYISFGGAAVQDFPGGPGYTAAHRAIGGVYVNGVSIDVSPRIAAPPALRKMLWSTDAATDFVQPGAVNYGDGPIERLAKLRVEPRLQSFIQRQKPGTALEVNMCADLIGVLKEDLVKVHDDVADDFTSRLARRGKQLYDFDTVRKGVASLAQNQPLGKLPAPPFRSRQREAFLQDFSARQGAASDDIGEHYVMDGRMTQNPSEDPYASDLSIGLQREEIARGSVELASASAVMEKSDAVDQAIGGPTKAES